LLASLLMGAALASAAFDCGQDAPCASAAPEPSYAIPAAHALAVMGGMRLSLWALWPQAFDPLTFDQNLTTFKRSWSSPPHFEKDRPLFESDGDPWLLNGVGHALFGSEVYQRARRCGLGVWGAAVATVGASTLWEYGPEAFHKQPSVIDLVWTPVSGVVLGELRHRAWRWAAARGPGPGPGAAALRWVVDPLGEAERGVLGTAC
jgi:hypothetical protein